MEIVFQVVGHTKSGLLVRPQFAENCEEMQKPAATGKRLAVILARRHLPLKLERVGQTERENDSKE